MQRHAICYEVLNSGKRLESLRHWEIDVHATPEELREFSESGYLVREGLFSGETLTRLQDALDRLEEREGGRRSENPSQKRSWGKIPRHLYG